MREGTYDYRIRANEAAQFKLLAAGAGLDDPFYLTFEDLSPYAVQ